MLPPTQVLFRSAFVLGTLLAACSAQGESAKPKDDAFAAAPSAQELLARLRKGHPRLLVRQEQWDELKRRVSSDATLGQWDREVRREADKLDSAPLPKHVLPDGKRLLSTSRSVLGRTYTLALAYRLHGDRRHLDRLWKELDTVAAFKDFNPSHFLDTAEMTHALAIAYDWLYADWTDPQRATLRRAIVELGLKPGLAVYRRGNWWVACNHNWNQVCNGGMAAGALAVADEEPELAGEILHDALASIPRAMASYAPDGAWGEGPGYWDYATTYNVLFLAVCESALGSDFGLSKTQGFAQTGLFPLYMTGPTGRTFNFSDSGDRMSRPYCLLWLARRFNLPVAAWYAIHQGKPSAPGLLWYPSEQLDPQAAGLPFDRYWRGAEVATFRSAWNDPKAVFAGIQAGSNRVNHNHLDLGSFVLDALGERWAVDLGGDDYNLPGYFGGKRYDYYRLRAEGHNTLVLNPGRGPDQAPKADCRIRQFRSAPDRSLAVADLTPAYAQHAHRVERGLALLDRRTVLIQDEIEAATPADVWWFLHTPAEVTPSQDGRTAVLQSGGRKLTARLLSPADARFEVRPAAPLPASPHPEGQRSNGDVRKLTIHLAAQKTLTLAVLLVPDDGKPGEGTKPTVLPLSKW